MSNGSGDEWAVVFTADGAFIRVFDHESPMTPYRELWPGSELITCRWELFVRARHRLLGVIVGQDNRA